MCCPFKCRPRIHPGCRKASSPSKMVGSFKGKGCKWIPSLKTDSIVPLGKIESWDLYYTLGPSIVDLFLTNPASETRRELRRWATERPFPSEVFFFESLLLLWAAGEYLLDLMCCWGLPVAVRPKGSKSYRSFRSPDLETGKAAFVTSCCESGTGRPTALLGFIPFAVRCVTKTTPS